MAKATQWMIPPRAVRKGNGLCRLPKAVQLVSAVEADALALDKTASALASAGAAASWSIGPEADAFVRVKRDERIKHPEGYRLAIRGESIQAAGGTDAGVFYALATLRELVRTHGLTLPCMTITDEPAFARRGVYHDCARGKVPKLQTLLSLVERLAEWKINELQLYVENAFVFASHPDIGRGYSPLTPAEVTKLQAHCRRHHMRLVPSLASFGHMCKTLRLPEYRHLAELPHGSTLCPIDPGSIELMADLYGDFLPLFEADDFNACGDETWELGRGRSRARAQKIGTGRLYLEFIKKLHRLGRRHGKRMNIWADIVLQHPELLGELPEEIVLLNWEYEHDGRNIWRTDEIAAAGKAFMVCPGTGAWLTIGGRWQNAWRNIRNFAAQGAAHGAEGVLNTDWGDHGHRQMLAVSLMPMAFGAAESWNPGRAEIDSFARTFSRQVFGDTDGALGDAIEALGSTHMLNDRYHNRDPLYFNLNEPIDFEGYRHEWDHNRRVDRFRPEVLRATLESLPPAAVWARPQQGRFEQLALAELEFSARLLAVYCLRSSLGWDLGLGKTPPPGEFTRLAEELDHAEKDFVALWRARNKPSLLRDNVKLFRDAIREATKLAGT